MGQNQSSGSMSRSNSLRSVSSLKKRSKSNKSSLGYTFDLPPCEEFPELMNMNTATEEQLMTLPGVNRQLAREIVRHRQILGQFKQVDDLALVSGIGAEKLETLRSEICTESRGQLSQASAYVHPLNSVTLSIECKMLSVNSSSVFQLQCVPGLNQEVAANIVDYRNKKGPFKSLDELNKVRGMDSVRLSAVKQHLSLDLIKRESVEHVNDHVSKSKDLSFCEIYPNSISSNS